MITRASVHFRHWEPNFVYQHLHILFFFNYVLLSKRMAFLGLLPFPLILCGTRIAPSAGRPSVSLIYKKMIDCITKPLSIKTIWNRELSDLNSSVDWERVWSNLSLTSKNLAHRLIHFKVIHRAYITPYKRFKMKLQSIWTAICVTLHHRALSAYVLGMSCRHQSMDTCKPGFVIITENWLVC